MSEEKCPCGSGAPYEACCGPYLAGEKFAPDPERLMRSRYTAFCRKNTAYLIETLDPAQCAGSLDSLRQELGQTMAVTQWLGLRVTGSGMEGPEQGWVEFAAFFNQEGRAGQLHEKSRFQFMGGRWVYCDGVMLPAIRLGRNEPCFCGSGKKYKKCHGKAGADDAPTGRYT